MMPKKDFESRYKECGALFTGFRNWKLTAAIRATERLTQDYPNEPRAWFLHNLAVCLANEEGGPFSGNQQVTVRAAARLGDKLDTIAFNDMRRDQAVCLITFARGPHDLNRAQDMINGIVVAHADDPSRQACLVDLRGRLAFARGKYDEARFFHEEARTRWMALGPRQEDHEWLGFNEVHCLRACIAEQGRRAPRSVALAVSVNRNYPEQDFKARILMAPGGLRAYRYLLTHR